MNFWNEKNDKIEKKESVGVVVPDTRNNTNETIVADLSSDLVKRWGTVQSALSAGSKVEGKLTFDRPVRIDGELIGEVKAKDALILIGPEAKVKATLEVAYLVVLGTVEGTVKATEKVDLMAGGRIIGDIETPRVSIQDGGILNGRCSMDVKNAATASSSDALKKPDDKSKTKSLTSPTVNGSTRVQ